MRKMSNKKEKKEEIIIKQYKIKNVTYVKLTVFLSILLVLLISLFFSESLNNAINGEYYILSKQNISINQNGLFVHYINVGQGDATLIELPDGKSMLIDCGAYSSKNLIKYIKNTRCNGIIDYFVLTHNHNDHYGQLKSIVETFKLGTIFRPNIFATEIESVDSDCIYYGIDNSIAFKEVVSLINKEKSNGAEVVITTSQILIENKIYDYSIDFLISYDNATDSNNYSPVILLTYKGYKYIFSGDATQIVENDVVSNYSQLIENCHVLKVGHHGSNTSSSQDYLQVLRPKYAVVSVLEGSYQNVPSYDVLSRLNECGVSSQNILRTDVCDTIISVTTNDGECILSPIGELKTLNNTVYIKWYYIVIVIFVFSTIIIFNKRIMVIYLIK